MTTTACADEGLGGKELVDLLQSAVQQPNLWQLKRSGAANLLLHHVRPLNGLPQTLVRMQGVSESPNCATDKTTCSLVFVTTASPVFAAVAAASVGHVFVDHSDVVVLSYSQTNQHFALRIARRDLLAL